LIIIYLFEELVSFLRDLRFTGAINFGLSYYLHVGNIISSKMLKARKIATVNVFAAGIVDLGGFLSNNFDFTSIIQACVISQEPSLKINVH